MSHEESNKEWIVPLVLMVFCTIAVALASVITMSTIDYNEQPEAPPVAAAPASQP